MTIVVSYLCPPVPSRAWDYSATLASYEPGEPIGYGETEDLARTDLLAQLVEIEQ